MTANSRRLTAYSHQARALFLSAVCCLLCAASHAQIVGLVPTPIGMYTWNPVTQQFQTVSLAATSGALQNTPQAFAFYGFNTSLGQWVPCTSIAQCFGGASFEVNGAPTIGSNPINFVSGSGVSVSNPSAGNIQFSVTGAVTEIIPGTNITCTPDTSGFCVGDVTVNAAAGAVTEIIPGTNITCAPDVGGNCVGDVTVNATASASTAFQMAIVPPIAGQFVFVPFSSFSLITGDPGTGSSAGSVTPVSSGIVTGTGTGGGIGSHHFGVTWTGAVLPGYVLPGNVTAIYGAAVSSNTTGPSNFSSFNCLQPSFGLTVSLGGPSVGFNGYPMQSVTALGGWNPALLGTISCTADNNYSTPGSAEELNVPVVGLLVYYTGPAPPASADISVQSPLFFNPAINPPGTLGIDITAPFPGLYLLPGLLPLPPPQSYPAGTLWVVSNGNSTSDCTTGGGTFDVPCLDTGVSWILYPTGGGGGGNPVQANGVAAGGAVSDFNNTTPAAPGGTTNVSFQTDGSGHISGNVPAGGGGNPVQANGVAVGGASTDFNNVTPSAPVGTENVSFQTDSSGHISGNIPISAGGLSVAANTNFVFCCDSRFLVSSSCATTGLDRGSITSGSVTSGVATFQSSNTYVVGVGNSVTVELAGFTGSYAVLNGQRVPILTTGLSGSQFEANVTGAPDGSTGTGSQFCAFNAAGLFTGSPYLPSSSSVINISIPSETLASVVSGYSTLIHPLSPTVTGKAATIILQAGIGDALGCSSAASIEANYATLWSDLVADGFHILQTSIINDNGSIFCVTPSVTQIVQTTNVWLKAQSASGAIAPSETGNVAPGWNYWFDIAQVVPDPTNPVYFLNPSGQTHGTDRLNYHLFFGIQNALLLGGDVPNPEYCSPNNNQACLVGADSVLQNRTASEGQLGVMQPAQDINHSNNFYWWGVDSGGQFVLSNGVGNLPCTGSGCTAVNWIYNAGHTDTISSTFGYCWADGAEAIPALCVAPDAGSTSGNQIDLAQNIGGSTPVQGPVGMGLDWIHPFLTVAPVIGSSCSGFRANAFFPSQDKAWTFCNGSTGFWEAMAGSSSGMVPLAAGTATVSTPAACTAGANCVYKVTNCGLNGSTAIGVPGIGTVTPGTSFVINSYTAIAGIAVDSSNVCWQIN